MLLGVFVGSPPPDARAASVLQGLERLTVHVSRVSEIVSAGGVDSADLVLNTSLALSRAGLVVLSAESPLRDTPFVSLALDALELPEGEIAFHASLELQEDVLLARHRDLSTLGSTWYSSRFGLSDAGALRDDVLGATQSMVDEFLSDWTTTAPPR